MQIPTVVFTVLGVAALFGVLAAVARRVLGEQVGWIRSAVVTYLALLSGTQVANLLFRDTSLASAAKAVADGNLDAEGSAAVVTVIVLLFAWAFVVGLIVLVVLEVLVPTGSIPSPARIVRGLRQGRRETVRYLQILWVFARHGTRGVLRRALPGRLFGDSAEKLAGAVRDALSDAGVTFVKFGQTIASRRDLIPAPIADTLASLQSDVPPAPWADVEKVLTASLGAPVAQRFVAFSHEPIAAASVGQVHAARLIDGRDVVVKVQRLGAKAQVEGDLAILARVARRVSREDWARSFGLQDLADGFAASLREELDYGTEAENTMTVRAALAASDAAAAGPAGGDGAGPRPGARGTVELGDEFTVGPEHAEGTRVEVRVPEVFDELSSSTVLVMERLPGVGVDRAQGLLAAMSPQRRRAAAARLLGVTLEQVLVVGTFHADMHPGNVLVDADGSLGLLDFGSVGRLGEPERMALASLLLAIDNDDAIAATQSLIDLLDAPADLDRRALERDMGQFVARFRGVTTTTTLFTALFHTIVAAGFTVPGQVAGAFRTFAALEGTLAAIDPTFDLVDGMRSDTAPLLRKIVTPKKIAQRLAGQLGVLAPELERLPRRVTALVGDLESGRFTVNVRSFADPEDRGFLTDLVRQLVLTVLAAASIIGSVVLMTTPDGPQIAQGVELFALLGAALALVGTLLAVRVLVFALRPAHRRE